MNGVERPIDKAVYAGVLLYVVFLYLTKGEAIRNVLMFGGFVLWLVSLRGAGPQRHMFMGLVPQLFWLFLASCVVSAAFSVMPVYSLGSLHEVSLRSALLFILLHAAFVQRQRIATLAYLLAGVFIFTIVIGYYSAWVTGIGEVKPNVPLRHANLNRYALDLNMLFPFAFVVMFQARHIILRGLVAAGIIAGIAALVWSTSLSGVVAFVAMTGVWLLRSLRRKTAGMIRFFSAALVVTALFASAAYFISPAYRVRVEAFPGYAKTLNQRTDIWRPLVEAATQRPVFGWGHGPDVFEDDRPFRETRFGMAPARLDRNLRQPHNAFLRVLFHEGAIGLVIYCALILAAIVALMKAEARADGFEADVLTACLSVLVGTFVVHSVVENPSFLLLTFIIGISSSVLRAYESDRNG